MNDKVIVKVYVPEIDQSYDMFLPINKRIGVIIKLLSKGISELSNSSFPTDTNSAIYNIHTKQKYEINSIIYNTDIRNGTELLLISQ